MKFDLSSWRFVSDGGDLGLRLVSRGSQQEEREETELSALTPLGADKEVRSGHVLCQVGSTYILTLDSTQSLQTTRTINYTFLVDLMESVTGPGLTEDQVIQGLRTGVGFTSTDLDPHIVINKHYKQVSS